MACDGRFAVGAVAADAPPAIAKDTPAIPTIGTALPRRFRFEACFDCDILESSHTLQKCLDNRRVRKKDSVDYHHSRRFVHASSEADRRCRHERKLLRRSAVFS
jgi:hypothetical protein